ncbi:MAG TPA: SDR family oxidoreductase [Chitinophagaceae bacterium]|nr:SDR family oxidoreductase [Chitinophagaceae bacterium]
MFNLEKKVAIITGAGSGIGKAIALLFAKQGAIVYILDFNGQAATDVESLIRTEGGQAHGVGCDVSDPAMVNGVVQDIVAKNGAIHILINNAGVAHIGTAESTNAADFDRLLSVNVKGTYHCLQAALPSMKTAGGVILNMASVASSVGIPDRFAYSMTKGAVTGMTLSVAKDYLSYKIRCNCISPARVHTPFVDGFIAKNYPGKEKEMFEKLSQTQPVGRMAEPEEVAFLALYLCSDEASFITGCDYPIDGGFIKLNN